MSVDIVSGSIRVEDDDSTLHLTVVPSSDERSELTTSVMVSSKLWVPEISVPMIMSRSTSNPLN